MASYQREQKSDNGISAEMQARIDALTKSVEDRAKTQPQVDPKKLEELTKGFDAKNKALMLQAQGVATSAEKGLSAKLSPEQHELLTKVVATAMEKSGAAKKFTPGAEHAKAGTRPGEFEVELSPEAKEAMLKQIGAQLKGPDGPRELSGKPEDVMAALKKAATAKKIDVAFPEADRDTLVKGIIDSAKQGKLGKAYTKDELTALEKDLRSQLPAKPAVPPTK